MSNPQVKEKQPAAEQAEALPPNLQKSVGEVVTTLTGITSQLGGEGGFKGAMGAVKGALTGDTKALGAITTKLNSIAETLQNLATQASQQGFSGAGAKLQQAAGMLKTVASGAVGAGPALAQIGSVIKILRGLTGN